MFVDCLIVKRSTHRQLWEIQFAVVWSLWILCIALFYALLLSLVISGMSRN